MDDVAVKVIMTISKFDLMTRHQHDNQLQCSLDNIISWLGNKAKRSFSVLNQKWQSIEVHSIHGQYRDNCRTVQPIFNKYKDKEHTVLKEDIK